jgi:Ca2+-binding EF-hand superfamily protein
MNWKVWTCAAALAFSGSLYAQDIDIEKEVDSQMTKYDTDKDGKITRAEYRAVELKETPEGEDSFEWLDKWKSSLVDFLAADTDEDSAATRAEIKSYYEVVTGGKSEKMGTLTKKDIGILDDEYLEPAVKWLMSKLDPDGNGKISKKEAEDSGADALMEYDSNKDGSVDSMEIKESEIAVFKALYDVEEGYTLKGEPSTADEPGPLEIPESVKKEFASVDTNKDGFISKEELKTARTKGQDNKAYWWGVYIAYLAIDADDDLAVTLEEFATYGRDEANGVPHKFYPVDKTEAMNEIWLDLDADKDGKVTKEEFSKLFPDSDEFAAIDADANGEASKDEMWDAFKGQFGESFEFPEKDREASSTNGGTPNPDDPMWALYKKEGRSWTVKNVSEFMGTENITYTKTEVIKVAADHCVIKITMMDKDKKPFAGMAATEMKVEFKTAAGGTPEGAPKIKDLGTETIKVEAGEFECQVTEVVTEAAGATYTTKSWSNKKYPGLSVKSETTSKDMSSKSELVEFKE